MRRLSPRWKAKAQIEVEVDEVEDKEVERYENAAGRNACNPPWCA